MRAIAVWLLIVFFESLHGTARRLLIEPYLGDHRSRQIAVFTGSLIIFTITFLFIRWIRAEGFVSLPALGFSGLSYDSHFEIALGRLVFDFSWGRIAADYNLFEGGLMGIGLIFMACCPYLAARVKGLK
ncbi:MAG: hypothetical protein IPG76_03815 [Acidobacteria bacterium]|nr:hypothetical protein [Acidobacteriota bacterium]